MLTALYIHVPFCEKICVYCDFHKEIATSKKKENYIEALIKELVLHIDSLKNIKTIYIGGGTPSNLDNILLEKLLKAINQNIDISDDVEFSIETNPNDITMEKAELFKKYKINRVSIGVQTFNQAHLDFLNRSHSKQDVLKAIANLQETGIGNINLDMMFSLVGQTEEELESDLTQFLQLDVKHISYYSLILEEKTKLYQLYTQNKISMNSEDLEAIMYNKVIDTLTSNGYIHYEISNFCKPGFESHHNIVYWKLGEYLGIGSGSHSLVDGKRFYNDTNISKYISSILDNGEVPHQYYDVEHLREELIMGFRMLEGINIRNINEKYQIDLLNEYKDLSKYINEGLLEITNGYIHFTRTGLLLGNVIFGIF